MHRDQRAKPSELPNNRERRFVTHSLVNHYNAQCVLCAVYFSRNRTSSDLCILKFEKYYPTEHIFVPACSSARKMHFFLVLVLVIFKL